jgi:transcriptional regulator with XRE-family HTH domain
MPKGVIIMQIRIGENLRKLRIKNELTQEKLAEVFGVSPQAISRWENK